MMAKAKGDQSSVSVTIPIRVKGEILSLVRNKEFKSTSDFLRTAIYKLLDDKAEENGDILKKKDIKHFIEKIS
jgi:Arc/MetJ-type ribon-helix-helix transcriptional regulator